MTRRHSSRPVLVLLFAGGLSACGGLEVPDTFEEMGERMASVALEPHGSSGSVATPSNGPVPALVVEVMDPHALWDARDGLQSRTLSASAPAGALQRARLDPGAEDRPAEEAYEPGDHTASREPFDVSAPSSAEARWMQLGAYASEAAARAAWDRIRMEASASALADLTPVLEPVEVGGRRLVRLKSRAPADQAAELCLAAGIRDRWCHQPG